MADSTIEGDLMEGCLDICTIPKRNDQEVENLVPIQCASDLDKWLQDQLHPADRTTLHVHFIDYDTPRDLSRLYQILGDNPPTISSSVNKVAKDIMSLCVFTDGVLLSWSGQETTAASDISLHEVFVKLFEHRNNSDKGTSVVFTLGIKPEKGDSAPKMSAHTDLRLQLLPYHESQAETLVKDTRQTFVTKSVREGDTRPVVCVLVGGDTEALKTAVTAVRNNIPVIVMKGSGGFADLLALLHQGAKLAYIRHRVHGKVRTVTVRVVEEETMKKIRIHFEHQPEIVTSLDELVNNLQLLTVYTPGETTADQSTTDKTTADQSTTDKTDASQDNRNLDAVLLEALIKHNKEAQINVLLNKMKDQWERDQKKKKHTYSQTVVENPTLQLDCFIDSLRSGSPAAVTAFLTHLKPNFFDFHLGRLMFLYEVDVSFLQTNKIDKSDREKAFPKFRQARKDLKEFAGSVPSFPLRCYGLDCGECNLWGNDDKQKAKDHLLQTCLHPIQELFLWALLSGNMDLTVSLWKHCDDKMAAALFARAVFLGMCNVQTNDDDKQSLAEYGKLFEDLAVDTLKATNDLDKEKTLSLINKECPWWGDVTVLDLALQTGSNLFREQPCFQQFKDKWDDKNKKDTSVKKNIISPKNCYRITLVWQIAFLALYSYVLLFDLSGTPSPAFIVLMVCVADTAFQEMYQLLKSSDGLGKKRRNWHTNLKKYWGQNWNKLDVVSISVFMLGVILVLVPNKPTHIMGRVVLAADVSVFTIRFLQRLMVFTELGLFLVMAKKMVMDTVNFMLILLTVMMSYAVTTESVLYPDLKLSLPALYRLPAKAFWQTFGELGLEEIQGYECEKDGLCPSPYGQYLVPVMVALYVIVSHVLLLNLLIARFNATFVEVQNEATRHQAWQRCQLVNEYKNRSPLPPPFSILLILRILLQDGYSQCCRSPDSPQDTTEERVPGMTPELKSSVSGKCVTISCQNAMQDFTVQLMNTKNEEAHCYSVPKGTSQLILWKDDPTLTVIIKDRRQLLAEEKIEISDQNLNQWQLQKFEDEQALYALSKKDKLDATQADTLVKATELLGSIDYKIQTAVNSALDARLPPNTPAGSSEKAPTRTAVRSSTTNEDTPPVWATQMFDSIEQIIKTTLKAQYHHMSVPPQKKLHQGPAET